MTAPLTFAGSARAHDRRRVVWRAFIATIAVLILWPTAPNAQSRIKDIVDFEGVRENLLVGYGLVVGLNGTGDSLNSAVFTKESLIGMLERLGVNARDDNLKTDNVAAVMVTATLPAFARQGSRIDVGVSALGDADNLLGGTLLVTPLLGADGEVYAVGQGNLQVGGFTAKGAAETITKGVPTSARIPNGAIVEREIPFRLANLKQVRLTLRNPDFTTARRVARAVNAFVGESSARVTDPGTVELIVPKNYRRAVVELLTDVEQLRVEPDQIAKVVIDEQAGVIVMGENVRISTVAIAQGNLTIRIAETPQVSQPQPFSNTGSTVVVDRTDVQVDEGADRKLGVLAKGVTLQELVNGINALGIGPRDMITILQAIKAAGALHAEIEVL
ncbi:MAG: flagellar basal body P-ring protein FlgI [Alphaproteobacteria bacterium]|nr:flagellar basal body P-ring protein FlgI [Alphaproteobacteria bacterium]